MIRCLWAVFITSLFCTSAFAQNIPKGKVIFSSGTPKNNFYDLFIVNSDGTGIQPVTNAHALTDLSDVYQRRLVYMQRVDTTMKYNIIISGIDGSNTKTILSNQVVCSPKWSPDGAMIVYEYYPPLAQDIWAMDSNGNNRHLLVHHARHPYWYADGRKLLFTRNYEVYSKNIKTGKEQQLTHLRAQDYSAKWPAISPDGKKLAFKVYKGTQPMDARGIMVIDLATGAQKIIPDTDMPYWTSDNHYMLCSSRPRDYSHSQILIVNIDTGEKTPITSNDRSNDFPAWVNE